MEKLRRKDQRRWKDVTVEYMTEESSDETGDVIRQHKLQWRSDSMLTNAYMIFAIIVFFCRCRA